MINSTIENTEVRNTAYLASRVGPGDPDYLALLRECVSSGQMTPEELALHVAAGELNRGEKE